MMLMSLNGGLVLMSVQTSKPTFRIIEGYDIDVNYEGFKKDFLNPLILKDELIEKYGLNRSTYKEYRKKVLDETGLSMKPSCNHRDSPNLVLVNNIRKIGDYYIVMKITYGKTVFYGRFPDYDTAKMVRNRMVESNWDKILGEELKHMYGMTRVKPSLDEAKRVYDEFEYEYFFSDLKLKEIREKLGIKRSVYQYLIMMIREKHGEDANRGKYR